MAKIENAPSGEKTSSDGTEKIPISGSQWMLVSRIASYIRTLAQTLTNKAIDLASNTLTGTLAQFNTAVSDADLASLAGSETLTNKTLTAPTITAPNISTTFQLTGDISPSQITANQNDYNPTGLSTATVLRLSTDASRDITSLQGGADGRIIVIHNVGSFNIVLKDDDGATGTAGNRFALSGDITLAPDDACTLMYDSTSSRWRCVGKSPGGGGSGSVSDTAYGVGWDGDTTNAPSKNAVYDKIEALSIGGGLSFFGITTMYAVPSSGWTWDNQGSSIITSSGGVEGMAAAAGGSERRLRYRTPANSHWSMKGLLSFFGSDGSGVSFGFRDSGGKLVHLDLYNNGTLYVMRWTSSTSFSAIATNIAFRPGLSSMWFKVEYDGTNLTFYYSIDSQVFHQLHTETRATFLAAGTPDFSWGANVISGAIKVSLLSLEEVALP